MGHEIVGRIVELGKGRTRDAMGDELHIGDLIAWAYAWCGECFWCNVAKQPTLCSNSRSYGWGGADTAPYLLGGFSEFAYILPRCKVIKVPEGLESAIAASTTCSLRTVIHGFEKIGGVSTIDTVVIQGAGAVGLFALAYALRGGAKHVITIGAPKDRLELASRWGAHSVIDIESTTREDRIGAIRDLTDGRGADLVVECAGNSAALTEGFTLVRRGGRYLVLGGQSTGEPAKIMGAQLNIGQLHVVGTVSADISHYYRGLTFADQNKEIFPFESLLGNRYPLSRATEALQAIASGSEIRPIIDPHMKAK
jgi:threonine dehydrogenase-like Zn-dependent dehydrogenase